MNLSEKIRRVQVIASVTIFLIVLFFCGFSSKFNLLEIELSHWGLESRLSIFWNLTLILLSFSMAINVNQYISTHRRMIMKKTFKNIFLSVFISLFFIGLITLDYELHRLFAYYYFFVFPLAIFLMAYFNRRHILYSEWQIHFCVSLFMIISPVILVYMFNGMAIGEISHSIAAVIWNLWILKKNN